MTDIYHWPANGEGSAWQMTGSRLLWWVAQSHRIAGRKRKAAETAARRR